MFGYSISCCNIESNLLQFAFRGLNFMLSKAVRNVYSALADSG